MDDIYNTTKHQLITNQFKQLDVSIINTKAMELFNNYPIMTWLLNLYSIERAAKLTQNNTTKYNLNEWIKDNAYCVWICKRFPKAMDPIKAALDIFTKRIFPTLSFNPHMKINDTMNDLAIYALAFYCLIYRIQESIQDKACECAPLQIDIIIICRGNKSNVKQVNDKQFPLYNTTCNASAANQDYNSQSQALIDDILKNKKTNKDYWDHNQPKETIDCNGKLVNKLYEMFQMHDATQKKSKRRKKYTFVIDRRNKWNDTIYFIMPDVSDSLPVHLYELREIFWTSSAKYLLTKPANTIGFSYHLLQSNNIESYLYLNGVKKFELDDIQTIFPIYFTDKDMNNGEQQLSTDVLHQIEQYKIHKRLPNKEFEEFRKQCKQITLTTHTTQTVAEHKLNVIDENNMDSSQELELLDDDLIIFKDKLFNATRQVLSFLDHEERAMIARQIWTVMQTEIIEQELNMNDIENEMKQLLHSKLLKTLTTSVAHGEYKDEILCIFVMIFGDNTLLGKEIIQNELKETQLQNNFEFKWDEKIIELRKQSIELKRHSKQYQQILDKKYELLDDEIIAIMYFSQYMNHRKRLNFENSLNWQYLFYFIQSAIGKMFTVFHQNIKKQKQYKTLYNGNCFDTLQQLSSRQIPLIFNTKRDLAIKNGKKMIIIIKDSKIGFINGELVGANIGWITNNDDEFIILPNSYCENKFRRMDQEMVIKENLPNDINIVISNKYINTQPIIYDNIKNNNNNTYNKLDEIRNEIFRIFRIQYSEQFAMKLLASFNSVIEEEHFDEINTIKLDLKDEESSAIFEHIWRDIGYIINYSINNKKKIISILRDILSGKARLFAVKDFTFTVRQRDVSSATKLVDCECEFIYNLYNENKKSEKRANIAEDKSLCIAKAVDEKNGYTILKWLLDSFSRDRIIGHKCLYKNSKNNKKHTFETYRYDKDKYSTGYNPTTWWLHDSAFCKYIQYKNAKMALPMMTAVQALSKRVLPQINFNSQLTQVIHDNLNHFVKYVFNSYNFIYNLITKHQKISPCQFDFIIVPQLVKPGKINPIFDLQEFFQNDNEIQNLDFLYANTQDRFNEMMSTTKNIKIWDLTQYLINIGGYIENKNFWVENIVNEEKFEQQLHKMWSQCPNGNTHKRYIVIIDRRNPQNVKRENMGFIKPNYFKTSSDWNDKLYLIIPKKPTTNGIISNECIRIPEVCLGYSAQYILPPNIGIIDTLNGYKFALSYHILKYNSVQAYSYINSGAEKFELDDMEWFWTRFFHKINGNEQVLNQQNIAILNKYLQQKRLPDDKFFEFWKQCHAMRIVHDR